jgi:hypothetical protein
MVAPNFFFDAPRGSVKSAVPRAYRMMVFPARILSSVKIWAQIALRKRTDSQGDGAIRRKEYPTWRWTPVKSSG